MANTRRYGATVRLDSGLLIPANAGVNKVLVSDAEGNAAWKQRIASGYKVLTESRGVNTAFEPSATRDTFIIAQVGNTGKVTAYVLEILVGGSAILINSWTPKTTTETREVSFIVPAGVKWEWKGTENVGVFVVNELFMS